MSSGTVSVEESSGTGSGTYVHQMIRCALPGDSGLDGSGDDELDDCSELNGSVLGNCFNDGLNPAK